MQALKKLLIKLLEETTEKIKTDTCELTEEEAMDIMQVLAHKSLSREQACKYLNLSRRDSKYYHSWISKNYLINQSHMHPFLLRLSSKGIHLSNIMSMQFLIKLGSVMLNKMWR